MKLFFTDPLKAAIAARDFGVRIQGCAEGDTFRCMIGDVINGIRSPYYVHKNSYPIFEPQVGDYGGDGYISSVVIKVTESHVRICVGIDSAWVEIPKDKFIIEKRNGLYFPWPERED